MRGMHPIGVATAILLAAGAGAHRHPAWASRVLPAVHATRARIGATAWKSQVRPSANAVSIRMAAVDSTATRTFRIMQSLSRRDVGGAGGAGGSTTWEGLQRLDEAWARLRDMDTGPSAGPAPKVVHSHPEPLAAKPAFDLLVCGGTVGIVFACALQLRGLRVVLVERAPELRGREQDWNVSRKELEELVRAGVLSTSELEACIGIEFNPMRCSFVGGSDVLVDDVLNVGLRPDALIAAVRARFESAGGTVREGVSVNSLLVMENGVRAEVRQTVGGGVLEDITARLVLDAMGNASPILRQQRHGVKPDGVCLVVGSCARGFKPECNLGGDIIASTTGVERNGVEGAAQSQLFWEAFPASSGPGDRTTYLFTYLDASPGRPSLVELFERYWDLLPAYQGIQVDDLQVLRTVFGFFPAYKSSPTRPAFDRVLPVGDAGGLQSPLSFGGFGALTRHLARVTDAVDRALRVDALSAQQLAWLQPYMPNLAAPWLFQKAMSVPMGAGAASEDEVNDLLVTNFRVMERLGESTLKPFLQDVPQFGPLINTIGGMMVDSPLEMPGLIAKMGPLAIAEWTLHMAAMAAYTAADAFLSGPVRALCESGAVGPLPEHWLRCALDAWHYGSGRDYEL